MSDEPTAASPGPDLTARFVTDKYGSEQAIYDDFAQYGLDTELERVHLAQGETLCEQGETADCFYILLSGRLGVRIQTPEGGETVIDELDQPFSSVGEMALLTGQARAATVYALADCTLLCVNKLVIERIAEIDPPEFARFVQSTVIRLRRIQLVRVLTDLFGPLDRATFDALQAGLEWTQLSHGETLYRRGDPGEAMYIVVTGRLRIVVPSPDGSGERVVGEVGPGEVVGEFSFLTDEPHSATALAIRETNVVKLTQPVFDRLLETCPRAMIQITRIIIKRHRSTLRVATERPRAFTLALIPADREVPLAEFARELAAGLASLNTVLHLDSARLDHVYGKLGAAQTRLDDPTSLILAGWLSEQETRYRYILYAADATWTPWTERCVRQADRILLVGQATGDPAPGPVETAMDALGASARTELVLLHPAGVRRPSGTSRWLDRRQVHAHHHVRRNEAAHYQRLAHRLTGRTVDLVLSGGAARGFAHLGVFRALAEHGIHVDRVGGTSMGALLGAAYAMGRDHRDILELSRTFANPKQLFDYTLPFTSVMASKKVTDMVMGIFEALYIEDLWRPFFCVSSNLSRAEPVLHQSGLLWKSVRASLAIPGIFSPILHEGDVLVDGSALNNFPVDVMHGLSDGGTVIGVNVSPPVDKAEAYQFGSSISGWQILWDRIRRSGRAQVPTIAANLVRSLELSSVHQVKTQQRYVDVLIQPDVRRFGLLDFGAYESIAEVGYQAAREQLAEWQKQ